MTSAEVAEDIVYRFEGRPGLLRDAIITAITAGTAMEREECAKLAASCVVDPWRDKDVITNIRMDIAAAIRARDNA